MTRNVGTLDRGARVALAVVLLYLAFGSSLATATFQWIAATAAIVFAATSIVGVCPLYRLVGLNTCPEC